MRPSKINPAYAHLAYQHAITTHTIALLQERYMGNDTQDPPDVMYCEGLPREDSEVPEDELLVFLQDLKHNRLELERQMRQFDFVPRAPLPPVPRMTSRVLQPPKLSDEPTTAQPQAAASSGRKRTKKRRKE